PGGRSREERREVVEAEIGGEAHREGGAHPCAGRGGVPEAAGERAQGHRSGLNGCVVEGDPTRGRTPLVLSEVKPASRFAGAMPPSASRSRRTVADQHCPCRSLRCCRSFDSVPAIGSTNLTGSLRPSL